MKRLLTSLAIVSLLVSMVPGSVHAALPTNKGLLISPIRKYTKIDAGKQQTQSFSIANLTEKPIVANLSVKQFSVSDYAYDYRFDKPHNDWLKISQTQLSLQPNKSQRLNYTLDIPKNSAPGGYYFTILASANLSQAGLDGTVQAASLTYITVNGKLTQTGSLENTSIKRFVFGSEIPYSLTVKNTGNVHYFAYVFGELHGLSAKKSSEGASHLLMPDTRRRLDGVIRSPALPGIYKATYGYRSDSGATITQSRRIVYIPPWSIAAFLLLLIASIKLYQSRKKILRRISRS